MFFLFFLFARSLVEYSGVRFRGENVQALPKFGFVFLYNLSCQFVAPENAILQLAHRTGNRDILRKADIIFATQFELELSSIKGSKEAARPYIHIQLLNRGAPPCHRGCYDLPKPRAARL